jgi:hypothetical protein
LPLAAHAQQAVPSIAQTAATDISKCAQNPVGFRQLLDGPQWNGGRGSMNGAAIGTSQQWFIWASEVSCRNGRLPRAGR